MHLYIFLIANHVLSTITIYVCMYVGNVGVILASAESVCASRAAKKFPQVFDVWRRNQPIVDASAARIDFRSREV